jgi:hypothetical protein
VCLVILQFSLGFISNLLRSIYTCFNQSVPLSDLQVSGHGVT